MIPKTNSLLDMSTIDTEIKAYLLGFIAADGCIYLKGNYYVLEIDLAEKDRGHLQKINELLTGGSYKLQSRNSGGYPAVRLSIQNKELTRDLMGHGIVPAKSLILEPPSLPTPLLKYWVRGYFDGDGCITYSKRRSGPRLIAKVIGTYRLLQFVNLWFKTYSGLTYKSSPYPKENTWLLVYSAKIAEYFLKTIYWESQLHLDRKFLLAQQYL